MGEKYVNHIYYYLKIKNYYLKLCTKYSQKLFRTVFGGSLSLALVEKKFNNTK